jgi:hypothetical protein
LRIDSCKGEGAIAIDDSVEVGDRIEHGDAETERG